MKIKIEERFIDHPMEAVLGLESNTTITEYKEIIPEIPIDIPQYDVKDDEIELKLEEIYGLALGTMSMVSDEIERVEGKYKSSLAETTTQLLTVALGAVREKSLLKQHKDKLLVANNKLTQKGLGHVTTNNNLIVANRNEILKALADGNLFDTTTTQ
jgi:hypothetical protein